ncbi:TetR/AcrR family transcriptional regulator [Novosphingobium mangrovi (ex Huang et al. 2023)]|uniref:TetR/AcrR family transcriptional regulator n=1 Tax=Novosphingobium mangrovi (ex Huang et al. 2023) TaxID=2976432 RepID=A0ABT2HZV1_9SPHN|nr:TetR/AcrR family transcriptional regulator [Novosphingobium mangrovi (ex Huang et al. 2023)]MCT2397963.1 TetR/AcrR family transcriptional regulator [Novosphingobium mangrovi (ex Huang et al. 2023)]
MEGPLTPTKRAMPTDARQIRSRKALNSALLALLEERSFDQLTIREITARAGTGYATFFRHYPDKEALLSDVATDEIAHLLAMTTPILYESNSYESTLALCRYVAEHARLWSALLTGGAAAIVRNEFIDQARALVEEARTTPDWLPSDLGVVHGTGSTFDILAWWLGEKNDLKVQDVATILHRLVIAPLIGDKIEKRIPTP